MQYAYRCNVRYICTVKCMKISTSTTTLNVIYVLDHIYNVHVSIGFTSNPVRKPGDSLAVVNVEPPCL